MDFTQSKSPPNWICTLYLAGLVRAILLKLSCVTLDQGFLSIYESIGVYFSVWSS